MGAGRLAMLAFLGFAVQALTQGEGALGELCCTCIARSASKRGAGVPILIATRRTVWRKSCL